MWPRWGAQARGARSGQDAAKFRASNGKPGLFCRHPPKTVWVLPCSDGCADAARESVGTASRPEGIRFGSQMKADKLGDGVTPRKRRSISNRPNCCRSTANRRQCTTNRPHRARRRARGEWGWVGVGMGVGVGGWAHLAECVINNDNNTNTTTNNTSTTNTTTNNNQQHQSQQQQYHHHYHHYHHHHHRQPTTPTPTPITISPPPPPTTTMPGERLVRTVACGLCKKHDHRAPSHRGRRLPKQKLQ